MKILIYIIEILVIYLYFYTKDNVTKDRTLANIQEYYLSMILLILWSILTLNQIL